MNVLVACEYSGRVRQAFRDLGHDAWSCDLLPAEDDSLYHMEGDVRQWLHLGWDLMIAHPPCTHLAISGAHLFKKKVKEQAEALEFVRLFLYAPIPMIAVENPVGVINTAIRKPEQIIQPYDYGEDASKKTCLWLKNLAPLRPTEFVKPRLICCGRQVLADECPVCLGLNGKPKARWANQTDSGQNNLTPSTKDRWKERSRTYSGIARAMALQWGGNMRDEL